MVVQPNTSRAQTFAEAFKSSGGVESLLVLLQREAKAGDINISGPSAEDYTDLSVPGSTCKNGSEVIESGHANDVGMEEKVLTSVEGSAEPKSQNSCRRSFTIGSGLNSERTTSASENSFLKTLDGIRISISGENMRNNVYNVDNSDGILVAIIALLGALVISGHLKYAPRNPPDVAGNLMGLLEGSGTMFDDKVSLLHFAIQKAFQAAPNKLMTSNACIVLLGASVNNILPLSQYSLSSA